MDSRESGHKGGVATKDNHPTLCPLCGSLIKSRFFSENGAKGGQATLQRHGREHYVKAGKMGGRGNKKNIPAVRSSGNDHKQIGVRSDLITLAPKGVKEN